VPFFAAEILSCKFAISALSAATSLFLAHPTSNVSETIIRTKRGFIGIDVIIGNLPERTVNKKSRETSTAAVLANDR
jgi:hypothetical protein